jgi:hypothetical protein
MALGISIPFEFSADGRGMPAEGLGNVFLRPPFPPGLPDIKPFFVTDVLIRGHGCRSFGKMDGVVASSYPSEVPGEIALIV